jgi:hypothetical protein
MVTGAAALDAPSGIDMNADNRAIADRDREA